MGNGIQYTLVGPRFSVEYTSCPRLWNPRTRDKRAPAEKEAQGADAPQSGGIGNQRQVSGCALRGAFTSSSSHDGLTMAVGFYDKTSPAGVKGAASQRILSRSIGPCLGSTQEAPAASRPSAVHANTNAHSLQTKLAWFSKRDAVNGTITSTCTDAI